jgi:magnesium transporter
MASTRLYRDGTLLLEDFPVDNVSEHLSEPDATIWVDLDASDQRTLDQVAHELGVHEIAIENATAGGQRPKIDRYPDHAFLAAYTLRLDQESGRLDTSALTAFVTSQTVVTVRQGDLIDVEEVKSRWDDNPDLASSGVAYLVWGLLDYLVDNHFDVVQQLGDAIESVEARLFEAHPTSVAELQRRLYGLRRSLVTLRRDVLPVREVVNTLMRRDLPFVTDAMLPYYQDVYDHVLRATEWVESLRDLVATVLEINLTLQGNRMNLIMKKVTSWAAIIAVPTAITGYYGQNLPFPGFAQEWGWIASCALIAVASVLLYATFKRADWL